MGGRTPDRHVTGPPDPDRPILEAATGQRRLTSDELRQVLEHVA